MSSQSFADLGVSSPVVGALAKRGITEPFAVQRLAIADVLAGRDVLVQSPTGSGKTLAFGVPMVDLHQRRGAPPRGARARPHQGAGRADRRRDALDRPFAGDQGRTGLRRGRHRGPGPQGRQGPHRRRHPRTPGGPDRARPLQASSTDPDPGPRRGRPHARHGLQAPRRPHRRPDAEGPPDAVLLGDAGGRGRQARQGLHPRRRPPRAQARRSRSRPRPSTASSTSRHEAKLDALVGELNDSERGRTLVFVRTKRGADRLVKKLCRHKIRALAMHGNKSQNQRRRALASFDRGDCDTLVATDVAARGIDVEDITHVINFDAPEDRDAYVHRTGRTGRAGATGVAASFILPDQDYEMGDRRQGPGPAPRVCRGTPQGPLPRQVQWQRTRRS